MRAVQEALNRTIDPSLLTEVLEAVGDLPAEDRGFEGHTFTIIRLLMDRGVPVIERANIALSISFRLQALAQLTADGGGRGWVLPGEPGCDFVHEELLRCAAEEPLIEVGGQPAFDAASFHVRLLQLAEMRGEA